MVSLKHVNALKTVFFLSQWPKQIYTSRRLQNWGRQRTQDTEDTQRRSSLELFSLLSSHTGSKHGEWRELTCFSLQSMGGLRWFCQLSGSKTKVGGSEGRLFGSPQLCGSGHSKKRVTQGCMETKRKYWNSLE